MVEVAVSYRYVSAEHYDLGPAHEFWDRERCSTYGLDWPFAPPIIVHLPDLSSTSVHSTIDWLSSHYGEHVAVDDDAPFDGRSHPVAMEIGDSEPVSEKVFWQKAAELSPDGSLMSQYVEAICTHSVTTNEPIPFGLQSTLAGAEALYTFADRWLGSDVNDAHPESLMTFTNLFIAWLSLSDLSTEVKQDAYIRQLFEALRRSDKIEALARLLQIRLFRGQSHNSNAVEILHETPGVFKMVLDGLIAEEIGIDSPYRPPHRDVFRSIVKEPGQDWRYEALITDMYGSADEAANDALDYIERRVGTRPESPRTRSASRTVALITDKDRTQHKQAVDALSKPSTGLHTWDPTVQRWQPIIDA